MQPLRVTPCLFAQSKGDYFGERALITSEPRAANVIGVTKGTAFSIDRSTFEKVLGDFSKVIMRAQDRRKLVSFAEPDYEVVFCVGSVCLTANFANALANVYCRRVSRLSRMLN